MDESRQLKPAADFFVAFNTLARPPQRGRALRWAMCGLVCNDVNLISVLQTSSAPYFLRLGSIPPCARAALISDPFESRFGLPAMDLAKLNDPLLAIFQLCWAGSWAPSGCDQLPIHPAVALGVVFVQCAGRVRRRCRTAVADCIKNTRRRLHCCCRCQMTRCSSTRSSLRVLVLAVTRCCRVETVDGQKKMLRKVGRGGLGLRDTEKSQVLGAGKLKIVKLCRGCCRPRRSVARPTVCGDVCCKLGCRRRNRTQARSRCPCQCEPGSVAMDQSCLELLLVEAWCLVHEESWVC